MLLRRVPDRSRPPQPSTQGGPDMQAHHQGEGAAPTTVHSSGPGISVPVVMSSLQLLGT